jgi:hypothetical protein
VSITICTKVVTLGPMLVLGPLGDLVDFVEGV